MGIVKLEAAWVATQVIGGEFAMLLKIITKLLFKASLPLIMVAGALSYGLYIRGGDPSALLGSIGAGIGNQISTSVASAGQNAQSMLSRAGENARTAIAQTGKTDTTQQPGSDQVQIYTWKDADGVTHYSSEATQDSSSLQTITVNPNVNVLAPVRAPGASKPADKRADAGTVAIKGSQNHSEARGANAIDPTTLINLLQSQGTGAREMPGD